MPEMNMPPAIRLSAGLGLPSERTGQVDAAATAATAGAPGTGAMTAGAAGVATAATAGALATTALDDCGQVDVTVSIVGMGVGVATGFLAGGTPTKTGNVTVVCWPLLAEMAYAAKSTPRFITGIVTSTLKARGSPPVLPGTALPRNVPPLSRSPRNRSTRAIPEPWVA